MPANYEGLDHDPMVKPGTKGTNLQPDASAPSVTRRDDDVTRTEVSVADAAGIMRKTTVAGTGNPDKENGEGPLTP